MSSPASISCCGRSKPPDPADRRKFWRGGLDRRRQCPPKQQVANLRLETQTEQYVDMLSAGIVDPAKVVRVALPGTQLRCSRPHGHHRGHGGRGAEEECCPCCTGRRRRGRNGRDGLLSPDRGEDRARRHAPIPEFVAQCSEGAESFRPRLGGQSYAKRGLVSGRLAEAAKQSVALGAFATLGIGFSWGGFMLVEEHGEDVGGQHRKQRGGRSDSANLRRPVSTQHRRRQQSDGAEKDPYLNGNKRRQC